MRRLRAFAQESELPVWFVVYLLATFAYCIGVIGAFIVVGLTEAVLAL